jgi:hypothetical protein
VTICVTMLLGRDWGRCCDPPHRWPDPHRLSALAGEAFGPFRTKLKCVISPVFRCTADHMPARR